MAKLQTLREFENLQMKDSKVIHEFFIVAIGMINQLKSYRETLEDQRVRENFMEPISKV